MLTKTKAVLGVRHQQNSFVGNENSAGVLSKYFWGWHIYSIFRLIAPIALAFGYVVQFVDQRFFGQKDGLIAGTEGQGEGFGRLTSRLNQPVFFIALQ